ncbi:MAG: SHOCT domain-containing protein, partial [Actinomycetota bacterium]|nr:SHOCT domain-containing protein [Actinomycetota bacterium]
RILKSARNSAKSIRATAERQASDLDILSRQLQTDLHRADREANSLRVKEPAPPTDSLSDVALESNTPPNPATPDQASLVAPTAALSATEPRDRLTRLRELKELRDILTDEEFEAEKSRILAEE